MILAAAQSLYLFAPLLLAAALAAVIQSRDLWPCLKRPIDAGKTFLGKRWFGDSKTWRGVAIAVVGSITGIALQKHAVGAGAGQLAIVDYGELDVLAFGGAMGAGAMLGELPNSFAKRRLGIAPGKTTRGPLAVVFYIWDQIDVLTSAWPAIWTWVRPSAQVVGASFAVALLLHPGLSLLGYLLGARKSAR